ncbi:hypothetical protein [Pseudactinotalea sp. Z1748]|uniref:hypothetical protein n=1 Tax=Pseudactinotalea sp. Z1748 TaxID=3413027 RepID=UPI003C7C3062
MIEGVSLGIADLGLGGLLILAVAVPMLMLYRGKIIPERHLLEALRERDRWREAAEVSQENVREANRQVSELATAVAKSNDLGELSVSILRALRDKADE